VTVQAVAAWFTGDTKKISPEYLAIIAKHYRVDLYWLITGEGSPDRVRGRLSEMIPYAAALPEQVQDKIADYIELHRKTQGDRV
jgi:hypothetical protein